MTALVGPAARRAISISLSPTRFQLQVPAIKGRKRLKFIQRYLVLVAALCSIVQTYFRTFEPLNVYHLTYLEWE